MGKIVVHCAHFLLKSFVHVKYYCTWLVHKSNVKRSFAIVGHMKSTFCKNKNNFFENYVSRNYIHKCIMLEPVNLQPYILKLAIERLSELEGFTVWEKQLLPPSDSWVVFLTNSYKLWLFQTVIFPLHITGLKI